MPFSAIHSSTLEVHDVTRKRYGQRGWMIFWGKQKLGTAMKSHDDTWWVFDQDGGYVIDGLAKMHYVYQYLLRLHGIWKDNSNPVFHRLKGTEFIAGLNKYPCKYSTPIPNIFFPSIDRWELDE